jgi:hypothetical protein
MSFRYTLSTVPARLDPDSTAYVKSVEASQGKGLAGIYQMKAADLMRGSPRSMWWLCLMAGLGSLAIGVATIISTANDETYDGTPAVQAILIGLGAYLLWLGVARFRRRLPPWMPGRFAFVDASHGWDVQPGGIRAVALESLTRVSGVHNFTNGRYAGSTISLDLARTGPTGNGPAGRWQFVVATKEKATLTIGFLQCLIDLRASTQDNARQLCAHPGLLGAVAKALAENRDVAAAMSERVADPPVPRLVDPDPLVPVYDAWGPTVLRIACCLVVCLVTLACLPRLDGFLRDRRMFAEVEAARARDATDTAAADNYMTRLPHGAHAGVVLEIRDDARFARAKRNATVARSPAELRNYLADAADTRHRPEAHQLIAAYYDAAIADLKAKQAKADSKVDPQLLAGVLGLLEAMKTADRPVVTVGFKSTVDPTPATDDLRDLERAVYDARLREHPELRTIADADPNHTAVIPATHVFDPDAIARRESIIMGRLGDAVRKGINADILTLRPAPAGTAPDIEVAYHILANGHLGTYSSDEGGGGSRMVGLLRWYEVDWRIRFRPPGTTTATEYDLDSRPGSDLKYHSERTDPAWGIYAVVLYSSFSDMSRQMIKGFGLDPGPAEEEYTLDAADRGYASADNTSAPPYVGGYVPPVYTPPQNFTLPTDPSQFTLPGGSSAFALKFIYDQFYYDSTTEPAGTWHWKKADATHWQATDPNGAVTTFVVKPASATPATTQSTAYDAITHLNDVMYGTVVQRLPDKQLEMAVPNMAGESIHYRKAGYSFWNEGGKVRLTEKVPATQP